MGVLNEYSRMGLGLVWIWAEQRDCRLQGRDLIGVVLQVRDYLL